MNTIMSDERDQTEEAVQPGYDPTFEDDYDSDEEPEMESDIDYGLDEVFPDMESNSSAFDLLTGNSTKTYVRYQRGPQHSVRTIYRHKQKQQALAESAMRSKKIDVMFALPGKVPLAVIPPSPHEIVVKDAIDAMAIVMGNGRRSEKQFLQMNRQTRNRY